MSDFLIFSGNASQRLAHRIANQRGCSLSSARISQFGGSESRVEILSNVNNNVAFIIQSTSAPCNQHILDLCFMADALRRAGARQVTAVIPYFSYARQDRNSESQTAIAAKVVAQVLQNSGIERIICLDLHSEQLQGFFNIPVTNLCAAEIFVAKFKQLALHAPVVVAPDIGGLLRARCFARQANISDLAVVLKNRHLNTNIFDVLGSVTNRDCLIIDDIVDSGRTITNAALNLKQLGAGKIYAFCTHGVLSSDAFDIINNSCLAELVITDSVEISKKILTCHKISQTTAAPIFATAIQQIMRN